MKTKEQWIDFVKKKRIRANKELINADLALNNEDHFYSIYLKQGTKAQKQFKKTEVVNKLSEERSEEYF